MTPNKKDLVVYHYTKPTTFVHRDIRILEKDYQVRHFSFYHEKKWVTPLLFIKQLVFIIKYGTRTKVSFCMFAGYHSLLPAILSKIIGEPFVLILGGTESVSIPSIGYGVLNKGLIGKFVKWSFRFTSEFAPVHESLIYYQNEYDNKIGKFQGVKHYFPSLKANFTVIPNGFDPEVFQKDENEKKIKNSFITAGIDLHKPHLFILKGIDLIISVAEKFPQYVFTIVGMDPQKTAIKPLPNVHFIPVLSPQELVVQYSKHEYYFQLSLSEGFPNALCEAMLCNCVPIVSKISSMPEIIGESGYVLDKKEPALLSQLIIQATLSEPEELAARARQRIMSNYHIENRTLQFRNLIDKLMQIQHPRPIS